MLLRLRQFSGRLTVVSWLSLALAWVLATRATAMTSASEIQHCHMCTQAKDPEPVAPESSEEIEAAIVEFMSDDDMLASGAAPDSLVMHIWCLLMPHLDILISAFRHIILVVPGHSI